MAANVLHNHNRNPYASSKGQQHAVLFTARDYTINLLVVLSPISLRVMVLLGTRMNSEGYATASLDQLARIIQSPRSYINKGILELARHNLIKKKKRSEYWINPDVFRSAVIELS
ncbi:hypothetical protein [Spirosoma panaciterrae]|uniref:hypothetical protein n=1 Tax=Spirosoma panaciterrae TaxID=496058 RepID=UPI00035EF7D1|nr:hypothetical protein [Spirosoma panaciterrae]